MNGLRLDGRCILGAFLVLLPAAFLPAARAQQDMSAAIERVNGSVFTIKAGQAVGTGFVVNPAGEALTCKHAVGEASQVEVTLANGESAKAQVVARDETQDLALLKLEKAGLPAVVFAPAADLKPGQRVAAVGALLGLKNSVTEGVVSALDREIGGHKYFQIDAALNSGSSGGPVVNSRGEVVGVATAVVKEAGNVGFALPSETALEFLRARNVAVSTALRTEGGEPPTVAPGPAPPASPRRSRRRCRLHQPRPRGPGRFSPWLYSSRWWCRSSSRCWSTEPSCGAGRSPALRPLLAPPSRRISAT